MTKQTKQFLKDLQTLCRMHGVEICKASRFWVFGRHRNQCEHIEVTAHLEITMHPKKTVKLLKDSGCKSHLNVVDLTKMPVRVEASAEYRLLQPDQPIPPAVGALSVNEIWWIAIGPGGVPLWPSLELRKRDVVERLDRADPKWKTCGLRVAKLRVTEVLPNEKGQP